MADYLLALLGSEVAAGLNSRLLSAIALFYRCLDVHAAGILDPAEICALTFHLLTSFTIFLYFGHCGFLQVRTNFPSTVSALVSTLHTGHTILHHRPLRVLLCLLLYLA